MNKQKLIDKYTAEISRLRPYCPNRHLISEQLKYDLYKEILEDLKQLDEPQKPVVPKFVADWFEDNKDALDLAIFMAIRELDDEEWPHKTDFENWLDVAKNKPIETLIRMKDGYEVEKESLYRVKLGEGYFVEYQGRGALIMIIPDDNKEIKIFDSKSDAERTAQTIGGTVEEVAEG
ncbi:DUF1642 domain-containing protein [Enterococcus hirae]|uniref:DUF1642 domain-containing protein n=1 Tax=Enterococcus hirae TaxID=1354 RepID=A0AB37IAV2_ENTHR|nr:DUF1642 domain-containing protein [Enterococcus hirae]MDV7801202.1 DUF1642 domain-containing protein [Enterococcus hirae]RBT38616.1 hypothetical protein EB07_02946 [Enterococcus hirae]RBT40681.1 hypothetical protein EB07_02163 [Enterococcus hirae]RBT68671.1 hypothetical protein EB03_01806 [Enterococcus hirae]